MREKLNWSLLSKYRAQLFGISILSIMIFHYFEDYLASGERQLLLFAKGYNTLLGSIGVEFFLFLSGMGMFFSLKKSDAIIPFYQKRLSRVMLPYAVYGLLFWIVKDLMLERNGIVNFFLDYLLLSFWICGNRNLWYIAFICMMYLAVPFLFRYFDQDSDKKTSRMIMLMVMSVLVCTILNLFFNDVYRNIEVALMRIPVFLLGLYCGGWIKEKCPITQGGLVFALSGFALKLLGLLIGHFDILEGTLLNEINRLINGFYAVSLLLVLLLLLEYVHIPIVDRVLRKAGEYSLELYMTHVTVRTVFNLVGLPTYKILNYLLCLCISVALSILLHLAVEKLLSVNKRRET